MKRLPFNACDYRCDRCLETAECAVFQKLQERSLQNALNGNDGSDPAALLRDIRESFRETEEMIKQRARAVGIDIDGIAGGPSAEAISEKCRAVMDDPLYKQSYEFTMQSHKFLLAAGQFGGEAKEYLDDIAWHHAVVSAKVYRAVAWRAHEDGAVDAKQSAAVAAKSLTICIMAFDYLASRYPALAQEGRRLSAAARGLKADIRKRIGPASAA